MALAVTPHDFPAIRWQGHWIWVPEEPVTPSRPLSAGINPHASETHGLFRKTIHLDQVPDRAPARLTADSRYALFVNGQEVFRGPIRSQPRRLTYDLFDLAPYLQPGENVLAVYVKYYGTPTSYWMPAAPNLTLGKTGILVFEANLGAMGWLASGMISVEASVERVMVDSPVPVVVDLVGQPARDLPPGRHELGGR